METVIRNWLSGNPEPWQLWIGFFVLATLVFERVVTLRDSWFSLRDGRNRLLLEKQQLEILKIRYEIEAIRKINQLPELFSTYSVASKKTEVKKATQKTSIVWRYLISYPTLAFLLLRSLQLIVVFYFFGSVAGVVVMPILLFSEPQLAGEKWLSIFGSLIYAAFAYGCYLAYRRLRQLISDLRLATTFPAEAISLHKGVD